MANIEIYYRPDSGRFDLQGEQLATLEEFIEHFVENLILLVPGEAIILAEGLFELNEYFNPIPVIFPEDGDPPFKTEHTPLGTTQYRRKKAWQARNFDGSPSGWEQGTPAGERDLVEKKFFPANDTDPIRYTNIWQ